MKKERKLMVVKMTRDYGKWRLWNTDLWHRSNVLSIGYWEAGYRSWYNGVAVSYFSGSAISRRLFSSSKPRKVMIQLLVVLSYLSK